MLSLLREHDKDLLLCIVMREIDMSSYKYFNKEDHYEEKSIVNACDICDATLHVPGHCLCGRL